MKIEQVNYGRLEISVLLHRVVNMKRNVPNHYFHLRCHGRDDDRHCDDGIIRSAQNRGGDGVQ